MSTSSSRQLRSWLLPQGLALLVQAWRIRRQAFDIRGMTPWRFPPFPKGGAKCAVSSLSVQAHDHLMIATSSAPARRVR
jgi:hypothetical protein